MKKHSLKIGVLAVQGDFAEHIRVLTACGIDACEVRVAADLRSCAGLIIPGGESTVMAKFLAMTGMDQLIFQRVRQGNLGVFGTCAGAVLVANTVTGINAPVPLRLIDMSIERNAYGTQRESFEAALSIPKLQKNKLHVAFIRAPKITRTGKGVEILASYHGSPVLVQQQKILAATFHPEVRSEKAVHQYFIEHCVL